ncbi:MAG: 3-hydroxyacyl-ACP dehydratase FabZ family protein [Pirellulales bacterium]
MNLDPIHAAIPHREPFLLVDTIVRQAADQIVCRKTFSGEEFWYRGHYPDFPLTPGVLLCEAAMQAGAILLAQYAAESGPRVPVATRMTDVKFKRMVRPGDTIEVDVRLDERLADAFFLTAKVSVDGRVAVRFRFACTLASRETLGD